MANHPTIFALCIGAYYILISVLTGGLLNYIFVNYLQNLAPNINDIFGIGAYFGILLGYTSIKNPKNIEYSMMINALMRYFLKN